MHRHDISRNKTSYSLDKLSLHNIVPEHGPGPIRLGPMPLAVPLLSIHRLMIVNLLKV